MDLFSIKGGERLTGETEARGSKNSATKLMVASLLSDEPCFLENMPFSQDVYITKELCESAGSQVAFDENKRVCRIETKTVKTSILPQLSRKNRIPILALGPLLYRKGFAEVPVLGGCPIGHRPINFHVDALGKMGIEVERREKSYYAQAKNQIHGAVIELPYPSVGATENILLTAVLAKGITEIKNAALEPEIMNLVRMLELMGAKIWAEPENRLLKIEGAEKLRGARIKIMPDRNEIVSLAVAALATNGDIFIKNISADYLQTFLEKIKEIGANFEIKNGGLRFWGRKPYRPARIETNPHPGFMTDWQQPFCLLLTQAEGRSIIHETVFEERFGYTEDFNRMGAKIKVVNECLGGNFCRFQGKNFPHSAMIDGPTSLKGGEIEMTDIRAGMAHIIAALSAEGESRISGVEHLDRGYEKIDERLRALGADIKRI